jgi:hypothetical protein
MHAICVRGEKIHQRELYLSTSPQYGEGTRIGDFMDRILCSRIADDHNESLAKAARHRDAQPIISTDDELAAELACRK